MKYITDTLDFSLERRSAVTLGKFDGLRIFLWKEEVRLRWESLTGCTGGIRNW